MCVISKEGLQCVDQKRKQSLSGCCCNKVKTREVKYNCFNCKRIPVNTLNEALKQATVTLQNTTKKDIVNFQGKKKRKKKSFILSERHTYEREQEGSVFTPQ